MVVVFPSKRYIILHTYSIPIGEGRKGNLCRKVTLVVSHVMDRSLVKGRKEDRIIYILRQTITAYLVSMRTQLQVIVWVRRTLVVLSKLFFIQQHICEIRERMFLVQMVGIQTTIHDKLVESLIWHLLL